MQELKRLYTERQKEFAQKLDDANKSLNSISFGRVAVALVFLLFVYLGFSNPLFFYLLPIAAAGFLYLLNWYKQVSEKTRLLKNLVRLNELEQNALNHHYSDFKSGDRFQDPHHPYSYDLDLFGKGSLFQYLNRCGTTLGENRLAELLLTPRIRKEDIFTHQEAVKDIRDNIQFRQDFWAHATAERGDTFDLDKLLEWLREEDFIEGKQGYKILLVAGPVITMILLAVTISDWAFMPALLLAMGIQTAIASIHSRKITSVQNVLSRQREVLERYAVLLRLLSDQEVSSVFLTSLKETALKASPRVKEFSQLVNALESRMNAISTLFGNSFFLYDLHSIRRLERWRAINAKELPHWLETIAETDALCSLSTFHFNNPSYVFPSIGKDLKIKATSLGHPLIASVERVGNDFSQGDPETIMIVTGANMAGKSTFLRAVGVNVVLALAGAPVCATSFSCPILGLRSGMRTSDSLQEHQSYFYAELHRLQSIMEDLRSGKPLLILLDEILKGTNSSDKQSGSIAIVEQLIKLNALVILATHDVILGDLQKRFPVDVTNGCFESQVEGTRLTFDYKLKSGIAQKANATFLMKQMGIIPKVGA